MGRALAFDYVVTLSAARDGYRILEADCRPAPGDEGYKSMCAYLTDAPVLMAEIAAEKPVLGRPLDDVLTWTRAPAPLVQDPISGELAMHTIAATFPGNAVLVEEQIEIDREAIRLMKEQAPQGGRIINIGSVSQKTPRPDSLPYTVCKHGLQGMTHQLTMDGRKHNIVASIIHPGATLSSFTTRRGRAAAGPGATAEDYVMAQEDVAKVAVLMAALPGEVNLYEATILPNHMRSFIGRG